MSDNPGYVYVIHNPAWPGWVKIGCVFGTKEHSKSLLESRISGLNVGDPHNGYSATTFVYAACARVGESYAHDLLGVNHRRGEGEWFACSQEEAHRLVEKACEIARLRPEHRKRHFDVAIEAERAGGDP